MTTLFIMSLNESLSNPAYGRHLGIKKLFNEFGETTTLNLFKNRNTCGKIAHSLFAKISVKKALKQINFDSIDCVVMSTISYFGMKYIKKLCSKKHKILIVDCVEFASPEEKRFGKLSFSYIHNTRINEHLIDKTVKTISISTYFSDFFTKKGIKTAVIPNLVDPNEIGYLKKEKHEKIELIFAGYPQKKDALNIVVEALCNLDESNFEQIHLTVAGLTLKDFLNKYNYLEKFESKIVKLSTFVGKVSSDEIRSLYKKADFSVLMRDNNLRVCKAGFPTKLLDSFKFSTPIIANLSSDIGEYLIDNGNGFVVDSFSEKDCEKTFAKICEKRKNGQLDIERLSKESFDTCIKCFNYIDYLDRIKELIES